MSGEFEQFRDIFLGEAEDILSRVEQALLRLENDPAAPGLLQEIFRSVHTLKGNAASMELRKMTELAHRIEDYLEPMAKRGAPPSADALETLFASLDLLRLLLRELRERKDLEVRIEPLLERLGLPEAGEATTQPPPTGDPPPRGGRIPGALPQGEGADSVGGGPERSPGGPEAASMPTVRVGLKRLDNVLNLVEELAITKARLIQQAQALRLGTLGEEIKVLERLINQLQQETLETRMVPVAEIFEHYRRVVRDTAHRLGKRIDFKIEDNGILVDRVLLEKINEPLVHLLRNAADHGVEGEAERQAKGKPAAGSILLRARGEQGYAVIEVIDDGHGMDVRAIRQKAVALGLATPEEAERLPDHDALHLICQPSFSTAQKVTDLSGRGVGMDVVQRVIESVSGRLEISTMLGVGSQFSLFLPLSLAIAQALLVRVERETYAVPLADVAEIVPLRISKPRFVDRQPVITLRGEVVPMLDLCRVFSLPAEGGRPTDRGYGVVVQSARGKVSLQVDEIVGRQEIVVKNLAGVMRYAKGFSGATILGDGRAVLILDVRGLL